MESIEELCQQVEALYQEHRIAPFPREVYDREKINGKSMVLLDSGISGCVSTFLQRDYTLDLWRTASLGFGYRTVSLALVSPEFAEEGKPYYRRLETMAALVLEVVGRKAQEADDT